VFDLSTTAFVTWFIIVFLASTENQGTQNPSELCQCHFLRHLYQQLRHHEMHLKGYPWGSGNGSVRFIIK
jgi:hypothetical protein